jgi:lipopolysaccharide biosynthesis glycosyltransferase
MNKEIINNTSFPKKELDIIKKKIIVTSAWGEQPVFFKKVTLPRFEYIAEKWNVEFKILEEKKESSLFNKLLIKNLCKNYDRVLFLDFDCVMSRDTPNMFDAFEEGYVYAALDSSIGDEDCFHRKQEMIEMQAYFGSISWTRGYYNSGVILMDKIHHYIWNDFQNCGVKFTDQTWFNYFLRKNGFQHRPLPREYNSFGLNSIYETKSKFEFVNLPENIAKHAYITHAAGVNQIEKENYIFKLNLLME